MKVSIKNIIVPNIPLAILLIVSCLGLWFSSYFGSRVASSSFQSPTITDFPESFILPNTLSSNIISLAFTLLNAFLIAQINNRFTIIRSRTFLPVIVFILLMSSWNETHITNDSHIVLTLIIFALFFLFSTSRDRKASEYSFMGSLFISVSSILINPMVFLLPVCWIGLILFQSFSLRTFLASIFGAVAPWLLFLSSKLILTGTFDLRQIVSLVPNFDLAILNFSLPVIVYSVIFISFIILSVIGIFSLSNGDAINTRNRLNFLILLLISIILIAVIFRNQFSLFLPLIATVFSLLFAHPFTLRHNNFYSISFLVFCFINVLYIISKYIWI